MLGGHFGGAEVSRPSRAGLVHQRRPAESDSSPNPSSREMAEVEISARAYVKMHLHAAKHPSRAVNGLLVAEKAAEGGGDCLLLTDCVPLFHNGLALSVMLEVALNQVDLWSATNNQVIAGYYQANSQLLDRRCTVESTLGGCITAWFGDANSQDKNKLQGVVNSACNIIGIRLDSIKDIHMRWCLKKATSILKDPHHPGHALFASIGEKVQEPESKDSAAQGQLLPRCHQIPE
ncbi:uncharacterized protein [Narcine bancroftii]|uniref:uncharacterized protein isoform X2 n=1 Tax=Narcine bancroftii TaxID=1343680 RepID=UPI003831F955